MTEDEHEMVKKVHDFLHKPPIEGQPSRAQQIDQLLAAIRAGRLSFRFIMIVVGSSTTIIVLYNYLVKGFE